MGFLCQELDFIKIECNKRLVRERGGSLVSSNLNLRQKADRKSFYI